MILDNSEKSLVQMKDLFGDKGWILLKNVFDTEGIEKLRGFLNEQRLEMDATFSKFVHDAEFMEHLFAFRHAVHHKIG